MWHDPALIDGSDNEVASVLCEISEVLDADALTAALNERAALGKYAMSVGAVGASPTYSVGSSKHGKPRGVDHRHLAKVFSIDETTAKRTLNVTTQHVRREAEPSLNRQYPTNDRALRYKHIRQHFFMDTFFATQKVGPTTRGNTCMQLFVTDCGYIFVVPMKKKSEVHLAMKAFFKRVGIPDAIICDGAREQTQGKVKEVVNLVGTVIRQLERNTPWANRAEC